jgi:glycosyltransferase involved in cell wall biosynthesis
MSGAKKGLSFEKKRQSDSPVANEGMVSAYSKLIGLLGRFVRFPGVYWWSAGSIVDAGTKMVHKHGIDVIIATHPFAISLHAAHLLSKKYKIPWIADMRDGWSSYYYGEYKYGTFYYKILCLLEKFYLNKAAKVVAINPSLAKSLITRPGHTRVLHNVFDPAKVHQASSSIDRNNITFAFAGSVHRSHCWEILFNAIEDFPEEVRNVRIKINYYGGSFGVVREKMEKSGVSDSLVINHGYLNKPELAHELLQADFLLVFGFSGPFGDTVSTGKIFDYIELGKPVIVVGPSTSELSKMVTQTGAGLVISSVDELKIQLRLLFADPTSFADGIRRLKNTDELEQYSANHVAIGYRKLLEEIVNVK